MKGYFLPRIWFAFLSGCLLIAETAVPARADNCSGLADCTTNQQVGLAVLAIAILAGLLLFGWAVFAAAAAEVAVADAAAAGAAAAAAAAIEAEAGAAAAVAAADAAAVGAGMAAPAMSAEASIASGAVNAAGRLAPVLQAIEANFAANAPVNALQGLSAVTNATAGLGLSPGVLVGTTAGGTMVIQNVGNVTTYIANNGQILVMRGADILMKLIP